MALDEKYTTLPTRAFDKKGMPNPDLPPSKAYPPSLRRSQTKRSTISPGTKAKLLLALGLILGVILLVAFLSNLGGVAVPGDNRPRVEQVQNIQYVNDLFVDINGDGRVDYLKYGEVIINQGP